MKVLIICLLLFGIYEANAETPKNETLPTVKKSEPVDKKPETKNKKVDSVGSSAETECERKALLSLELAKVLCDGETSLNPLTCFKKANHGTDRALAILCSGAKSLAPLSCFYSMNHGTNSEIAILCSGVTDANWKKRVRCFYDDKKSGTHLKVIKQCATKGLDLINIL